MGSAYRRMAFWQTDMGPSSGPRMDVNAETTLMESKKREAGFLTYSLMTYMLALSRYGNETMGV